MWERMPRNRPLANNGSTSPRARVRASSMIARVANMMVSKLFFVTITLPRRRVFIYVYGYGNT